MVQVVYYSSLLQSQSNVQILMPPSLQYTSTIVPQHASLSQNYPTTLNLPAILIISSPIEYSLTSSLFDSYCSSTQSYSDYYSNSEVPCSISLISTNPSIVNHSYPTPPSSNAHSLLQMSTIESIKPLSYPSIDESYPMPSSLMTHIAIDNYPYPPYAVSIIHQTYSGNHSILLLIHSYSTPTTNYMTALSSIRYSNHQSYSHHLATVSTYQAPPSSVIYIGHNCDNTLHSIPSISTLVI